MSCRRRAVLGLLVAFGVSIASLPALAQSPPTLRDLPRLKTYTNERASSFETNGANDDGGFKHQLKPGETRTLAKLDGPGVLTHLWFTIATREAFHLKKIVLRVYWDGEENPSVEAPIGDFFGLGLGDYFLYESEVLSVGSQKALNSFFPMPFRRSAEVRVTNE